MRCTHLLIGVAMIAGGSLMAQAPMPQQTPVGPTARPGMPGQNPNMTDRMPDVTGEAMTKVDDNKFAREAAMGGLTEVALGKLAEQKGGNEAVRQFGQRMVEDHTKADDQLKSVASAQSIKIPDELDGKHQAMVNKLSKLSGAAFDKAYAKDMVKDHEQDVRDFKQEAQGGKNPAVKSFAAKTLPVLEQHLALAKDLHNGKSQSDNADRAQQ